MTNLLVATYNIQFGINTEKIIKNIEKLATDGANVICIQEVIINLSQEMIVDAILKRLGKNWHASYHMGDENSKLSIGTAIFWNSAVLKFKHDEKTLLPKIKKFAFHENFYYWIIGVPAMPLQRRALTCYFEVEKKLLRVTCVHVDNVGGPIHRMRQLTYLTSKLKQSGTVEYEIICGDFNTFDLLKTGYEKKLLQKKFGDKFIDASKKVGWTSDIYNIDYTHSVKLFPWIIKNFHIHIRRRLDYIWVKNMQIVGCKKIALPGSDHYPIIADLSLE
jgi:endonuclease/exonuclease/phosphatase family metal-dependent hydrolase